MLIFIRAILPWIVIVGFSYVLSGFLYTKFKLGRIASLLTAFSLGPIFAGQILYIFYLFTPEATDGFYLGMCLVVIGVFMMLIYTKALRFRIKRDELVAKLKSLDTASYLYLASVVFILIFALVRMVFWPLVWSDQVDYYFQAHGFATEKSSEYYTLNPLVNKKVVGIRPGLPLMTNFFVLFEKNNLVIEKQVQLIIFYYFVLTILALYFVVNDRSSKPKDIKRGLFAIFLLLTCFYLINFVIYGIKEIVIVSLIFSVVINFKVFSKVDEKVFKLRWVLFATILGAASFVHFTGTVVAFIVGISHMIVASGKLKNKLKVAFLVGLLVIFTSLGEVLYFSRWVTRELTPPSLIVALDEDTKLPVSRLDQDLEKGKLRSYDISTPLEVISKGKLQGFTQVHYYGLVYWVVSLLILLGIKLSLKEQIGKFVVIFTMGFFTLIMNPFSLVNHAAIRVLVSSPKYYLMLLPFMIVLSTYGYRKFERILTGISDTLYRLIPAVFGLISLLVWFYSMQIYTIGSKYLVTTHRTQNYYISRITQLAILALTMSVLMAIYVILARARKSKIAKEAMLSAFFLLLPFLLLLNNNYPVSKSFKLLFSSREEKLSNLSVVNPGLFDHISEVVRSHEEGELVLLYGTGRQLITNYHLLVKHNFFFEHFELPKYAFDNQKDIAPLLDYTWIIRDNGTQIQDSYLSGREIVSINEKTTLYKRN